jgi:hypothetical protein
MPGRAGANPSPRALHRSRHVPSPPPPPQPPHPTRADAWIPRKGTAAAPARAGATDPSPLVPPPLRQTHPTTTTTRADAGVRRMGMTAEPARAGANPSPRALPRSRHVPSPPPPTLFVLRICACPLKKVVCDLKIVAFDLKFFVGYLKNSA